jgi:hypothetical protein
MRWIAAILLAIACASLSGCAAGDVLFAAFGDGYTNGTTREDRYQAMNADLERSRSASSGLVQ